MGTLPMRPHVCSARSVVVSVVVSVVDRATRTPMQPMPEERGKTVLHYEKLDVYQVSIQFVAVAVALSGQLPKGYAPLADQLRRAAWSIPLHIAEGVGKPSPSDQARFHAIARGSAMECGAILDVAPGAAGELTPRVDERQAADCSHRRDVD